MKKNYLFLTAFLMLFLYSFTANAATYTVTKTADTNDGACDADCSFREAIGADNSFGQSSTILFAGGLSGQTITITAGIMPVFKDITITGLGANVLTISISGSALFDVVGNNFIMSDVTVTGGNSNGASDDTGGAIKFFNGGTVAALNRTHFIGNSAGNTAGAIYFQGAQLTINNSTFSGNTTPQCGALSVAAGTVNITNTTFSGNTSSLLGGALCSSGGAVTTLRSVTISGNSSDNAGGIWKASSGSLNLGNSVVAGNTATTSFPEIWYSNGTLTSSGNNHIGDSVGDSTATSLPVTWLGSDTVNTNPQLGALTIANGGSTPTRIPLAGSPLINTGSNALAAGLTRDQRGFLRLIAGTVDKGAIEFNSLAPTAAELSVGGRVSNSSGRAISGAEVSVIDSRGVIRKALTNPFGYYSFDALTAGEVYVLSASAKGLRFEPQVLTATENLAGYDLTALPQK